MAIDSVLHSLERLYLLLCKLVFHVVEKGELAYAIQNRVNHLYVHRRAEKKQKRLYLFLLNFSFNAFLLFMDCLLELLDLDLAAKTVSGDLSREAFFFPTM